MTNDDPKQAMRTIMTNASKREALLRPLEVEDSTLSSGEFTSDRSEEPKTGAKGGFKKKGRIGN